MTPDILVSRINFSDYFIACKSQKSLKETRTKVIKDTEDILSQGFGKNERTDQLSELLEIFNEGDLPLIEKTFIEYLDIQYKSRLHSFDTKKKRKIQSPSKKSKKKRKTKEKQDVQD